MVWPLQLHSSRRYACLAATSVSRCTGLLVIAVTLTVLTAWAIDMNAAAAWVPGLNRMNPMTAASLALAGLALLLPRSTRVGAPGRLKLILGCAVASLAAVKLATLAVGQNASVDMLFFPEQVAAIRRSLMAPNTALALFLLGLALAVSTSRSRKAILGSQLLASGALIVATAGLIGHAYGAFHLYEFSNDSAMALHTAICLVFAAVGVIWIRPRLGVAGILTSPTLGGDTARRLIPIITMTTLILGAVRVHLTRLEYLDEISGVALFTTLLIAAVIVAVLTQANDLRRMNLRLVARERALEEVAAQLAQARDAADAAMRVKADFIANMSHEIRTPLTAIVGYADRLARRTDLDEAVYKQVSRINTAGESLLSIVNDVLDFSKLEAGRVAIRPRAVDPASLVAGAVRFFEDQAAGKGLTLSLRADGPIPPSVLADPDRLHQILLNLIGNAIKFTDEGFVRVGMAYHAVAEQLEVRVEDSGPGLNKDQQEALFRRFSQVDASSTRRHGGTGLGLAICKGLVEAMDGEIGVDRAPGGGSVFHFRIAAPIVEGGAATLLEDDSARLTGMRVLVVDDDPVNRDLVASILSPLGVKLTEAADGAAGVTSAATRRYDAILMDIRMPGLDGFAAASRIRNSNVPSWDTPILAFSANVDLEDFSTEGFTFDGLVRKPFTTGDLVAAVAACRPSPK